MLTRTLSISLTLLLTAGAAAAQDAVLSGNLVMDDDVLQIPWEVKSPRSRVVLQSYSWEGGTDTDGTVYGATDSCEDFAGGFDVIVSVFDSSGDLVDFNDDAALDIDRGIFELDSFLELTALPPDSYTITISQYDNLPEGDIATAFLREGEGNFTADSFGNSTGSFWDLRSCRRTSAYAVEVLGGGCRAEPRTNCRGIGKKGKAKLKLTSTGEVAWKWSKGKKTKKRDFGKPHKKTDYDLCVYETVGANEVSALELPTQAGAKWSKNSKGFDYRKKKGNESGVRDIELVSGATGSAKTTLAAVTSPPAFTLPLSADGPVTAQLVSANGNCWDAQFDVPSRNDAELYKAVAR